jgi:hypothetical protein
LFPLSIFFPENLPPKFSIKFSKETSTGTKSEPKTFAGTHGRWDQHRNTPNPHWTSRSLVPTVEPPGASLALKPEPRRKLQNVIWVETLKVDASHLFEPPAGLALQSPMPQPQKNKQRCPDPKIDAFPTLAPT